MNLAPCPACTRHIDTSEVTCPFCKAAVPSPASVRPIDPPDFRPAPMYGGPPVVAGMSAKTILTIVLFALLAGIGIALLRR